MQLIRNELRMRELPDEDREEMIQRATTTQIISQLSRIIEDHEKRLRVLERIGWLAAGIALVGNYIMPLLKPH